MKAYLQEQDLWDLISGDEAIIPEDTLQNAELRRKWKIKCGKALFALRTSISQEYVEHVRDVKSPKQVWETLERLFTQKNTIRLQYLENELAGMTQHNLSVSEYFLKLKTLCSEISELDTEEPVSEARLEALVKQISGSNKLSPSQVEDALYTKDKAKSNYYSKHASGDNKQFKTEWQFRGANVAHETSKFEQLKWEQCLSIEAVDQPVVVNSIVQQTNAEPYANASIDYSKDWIVDYDCSHHATRHDSLLSNVRPHYGNKAIVTANNSLHPVVNEGQFDVKKDISNAGVVSLEDVYRVPGLKKNLASFSQIADSRSDAYMEKTEIHQDVVCPGCQYGKSHRLPFPNSKNRAIAALQLVHSDLMGPTRIPSYNGFHYVMVLVDDFSRFTWVFFLEHKSETFFNFIQFKEQVGKEFGLPIKCLCTDNGGEYMSDQFLNYCREHDLRRQMTCPETPQQNGVAERKLAHLTSMCLSWLHAKNLSRELRAAAIQSACHVINRLPSWPGT
ncbi:uncharacterized protein LOC125369515 [Ricinus communis]|uniref:uncharacterized protein LOC125369515 n=1 Tax=Ricinus communis TaxID=3988 RepID=UPI00201AD3CF|nr:uncharacterized protein LOC125369515 [Ricinus communis]